MSHHGPLRNEFFKYRKRKQISMDGSVPGAEYRQFHGPTTPSLGSSAVRGGSYEHKMYMGDIPKKYRPNINAHAVQGFDYETYESFDIPTINKTPDARRNPSTHLPGIPGDIFLSVKDDLPLSEQFLMNMGVQPRPQEGPIEVPLDEIRPLINGVRSNIHIDDIAEVDTVPRLSDIRDALRQLDGVLPEDHPDIINLRNAAHIMSGKGIPPELLEAKTPSPDIASVQPYAIDQVLETFDSYQHPSESDNSADSLDVLSTQKTSLEQIVENEMAGLQMEPIPQIADMVIPESDTGGQLQSDLNPDVNAAMAEINHAVNQIIDATQPEPDPFQMEEDPYLIAQQMFDQQMQFMNNPFMMPGP